MSNVLALKYSTAEPESLIGVLTMDEVIEVMKDRLRAEVRYEVAAEFHDEISDLEQQLEEEGDWQETANSWECNAVGLYRGIEKALTAPWTEGVEILRKAMEEHGFDIDDLPPPKPLSGK